MHNHIEEVLRILAPVLKDKSRAEQILKKHWQDKIAIVWSTKDVHTAANELDLALREREAIQVLQTLHNPPKHQFGLKWEDIPAQIQDKVLGRKMTKREVDQFVKKAIIIINK